MVIYSRGRGFDSHPDQRLFYVLGRKKFLILLISEDIFCNASLMTKEYVQICVNCRSTLSMLAGMMNP